MLLSKLGCHRLERLERDMFDWMQSLFLELAITLHKPKHHYIGFTCCYNSVVTIDGHSTLKNRWSWVCLQHGGLTECGRNAEPREIPDSICFFGGSVLDHKNKLYWQILSNSSTRFGDATMVAVQLYTEYLVHYYMHITSTTVTSQFEKLKTPNLL